MTYKVMDLFSGAGGFSTGMIQAGFKVIGGVDIDPDAAASWKKNHHGGGHHAPMAAYTGYLSNQMRPYKFFGDPDVVVGGPPCQAFSANGQRDPDDPRTKLYLDYIDFVSRRRPLAFVMENVANLPTIHGGRDMRAILFDLEATGYHISWKVLNAWMFGLPQARKRTIIVGSMFPGFKFPKPIPEQERKSVRDAIGKLDMYEPTEDGVVLDAEGNTVTTMHWAVEHEEETLKRIRRIPEGGRLYKVQDEDERRTGMKEKRIGRHSSYGRLAWDKPALAITGSSGKASSTPCIHPRQDRALTIREAARLQGFADSFEFVGSKESIRMQIGNAVPPLLGRVVGQALLDHFHEHQQSVDAALLIKKNNVLIGRELLREAWRNEEPRRYDVERTL